MAKKKKTSSAKIFFWIFLGWWLYPFKWLFWDFPKWAIKSSSKKGTKIDGSYVLYSIGILIGICILLSAGSTGVLGVIFGLILLGGSGWMIYRTFKKRKKPARKNESAEITFPETLAETGETLYKTYDRVKLCIIQEEPPNYSLIHAGDCLELRQEPENPYDSKAIAVYDGEQRIGYIYRGAGQDMTNDFLKRGNTVLTYVQEKNMDFGEIYMKMAYYK